METTQVYYVNLLNPWREWESLLITPYRPAQELEPQLSTSLDPDPIQMGEHLCPKERAQERGLVKAFLMVIVSQLGQIHLVKDNIQTEPGQLAQEKPGPLPPKNVGSHEAKSPSNVGIRDCWRILQRMAKSDYIDSKAIQHYPVLHRLQEGQYNLQIQCLIHAPSGRAITTASWGMIYHRIRTNQGLMTDPTHTGITGENHLCQAIWLLSF